MTYEITLKDYEKLSPMLQKKVLKLKRKSKSVAFKWEPDLKISIRFKNDEDWRSWGTIDDFKERLKTC